MTMVVTERVQRKNPSAIVLQPCRVANAVVTQSPHVEWCSSSESKILAQVSSSSPDCGSKLGSLLSIAFM
ncbi:hypothetical protein TNCV_2339501 [Trichonephila clavipes]|nr:hypothetical protein TNCV_2339501 [Trichonephila clavipes]